MAPKRKGNPLMKCRLAGYSELNTPVATREQSPSTQATEAKRAPGRDTTDRGQQRGSPGAGGSSLHTGCPGPT